LNLLGRLLEQIEPMKNFAISSRHPTKHTQHYRLLLRFEEGVLGRFCSRLKTIEDCRFVVDAAFRLSGMRPFFDETVANAPSDRHDESSQSLGFANRTGTNRLPHLGQRLCDEVVDLLRSKVADEVEGKPSSIDSEEALDGPIIRSQNPGDNSSRIGANQLRIRHMKFLPENADECTKLMNANFVAENWTGQRQIE
jgi:hypothetical protein